MLNKLKVCNVSILNNNNKLIVIMSIVKNINEVIMKKKIFKTNDIYEMQEADINIFSENLAKGFAGYELFEYFCQNEYDFSKMKVFWEVALRASYNYAYSISDSVQANGVAVFFPPEYKDIGFISYLNAGGYRLIPKLDVVRMLKFDNFASKIKKKYADESTWYLYSFAVLPEVRGTGIGSKLLKTILNYFDQENQTCYLETLKKENVSLYEHYGFKLMEEVKVPGSEMTLYAMLRKIK